MRLLMISTDRRIFEKDSPVQARMIEYGNLFDELHIVVFTDKTLEISNGAYVKKHGLHFLALSEKVFVYPTRSINRYFYIQGAFRIGKKIIRKTKMTRGDTIITAQDPFETGIVGHRLSIKTKIKLNIQVHTDFLNTYFSKISWMNWFRVLIGKHIIKKAKSVRVVSSRIKNSIMTELHVPEYKIFVLPIFTEIEKFKNPFVEINLRERYRGFKKIILMMSRIEPEKNVLRGIQAFFEIWKKHPDYGLVVVGSGSQEDELKAYVQKYKPRSHIVFLPWQDNVASIYKTADVFLNTSYYEGYGLTLIEAAATGLPIVTTDVGIANDILEAGKGALVCRVGDKGCLVNALELLFSSPEQYARISDGALSSLSATLRPKEVHLEEFKKIMSKTLDLI